MVMWFRRKTELDKANLEEFYAELGADPTAGHEAILESAHNMVDNFDMLFRDR